MKTNKVILLSLISLFIMISCQKKKANNEKEDTTYVQTIKPTIYDNNKIVTNGVVESKEIASIGTRIMGYVKEINIQQGESVKKGDLLISISDQDLQAQLISAKAMLTKASIAYTLAQKDENRYKILLKRKSCSQKEYEQIHLQFKSMQAAHTSALQAVKQAEEQIKYTQIKAPFDGTISTVYTKQGSLATPGLPLITIEKAGVKVIQTQINENFISQIKIGMISTVKIENTNISFPASVIQRSISSISTGGQYKVTLQVPKNLQKSINSGSHTKIYFSIKNEKKSTHIFIPKNAIITQGGMNGVFVASKENYAILHWVRIGKEIGKEVEILSGIQKNDNIIIPHSMRLSNGTKITIK